MNRRLRWSPRVRRVTGAPRSADARQGASPATRRHEEVLGAEDRCRRSTGKRVASTSGTQPARGLGGIVEGRIALLAGRAFQAMMFSDSGVGRASSPSPWRRRWRWLARLDLRRRRNLFLQTPISSSVRRPHSAARSTWLESGAGSGGAERAHADHSAMAILVPQPPRPCRCRGSARLPTAMPLPAWSTSVMNWRRRSSPFPGVGAQATPCRCPSFTAASRAAPAQVDQQQAGARRWWRHQAGVNRAHQAPTCAVDRVRADQFLHVLARLRW